jgi:HEAT repeat protein
MKRISASVVLLLAIGLTGCPPKPKDPQAQGFMPGDPTPPPHYPKSVPMPVDPALQASAEQEIQSALHSSDEVIRANAIETLKDTHLPHADEQIIAALADKSLLVRKAAAMAVGELRLKSAIDKLQPLLDGDMGVMPQDEQFAHQLHMAAIFALHRLGNTTYSHELEQDAFDNRDLIRRDAAFILGRLDEKSAIPLLQRMLHEEKDVNTRLMVAEALWRLGDEVGENALLEATVSAMASDQMIVAYALAVPRDTRLLAHIEGMMNNPHLEVNLVCARAAGMLGSDVGYGYVLQGAQSVDPRQRFMAAMAFGDIGRTDSQPKLAKLLKDTSPEVRLAAARALVEIDEKVR